MSSKKLTPGQLKKFRSEVARLKEVGLVSKRVDARGQKPTRHMLSQVKKYEDVLKGKAKVVHTSKVSEAKAFAGQFRTKGKSVVVPVTSKDVRLAYGKKSGNISATTTKSNGEKFVRDITPGGAKEIKGKHVLYSIPIGNTIQSFDTFDDLVLFMEPYDVKSTAHKPYKNWQNYVQITRLKGKPSKLDLDEQEEF